MVYEFEPQNKKNERTIISVTSFDTLKVYIWNMSTNQEDPIITLPCKAKELLISVYKNKSFVGNFYTNSSIIRTKRIIINTDKNNNCISMSMVI